MTDLFTPLHLIFYLFAGIAIASAVVVVSSRNPVHSVLALVLTFIGMAGIWMILHAEFLSLILVLVYVGAVMTLFLFVVMMINIDIEKHRAAFVKYLPFGSLVVLLITALIIITLGPRYFGLTQMPLVVEESNYNNLQSLGMLLYTNYAFSFEIAGVLLLAAIIAAISLAHRRPSRRKVQKVTAQVAVRPEDRVRLIKMPSEPKQGA